MSGASLRVLELAGSALLEDVGRQRYVACGVPVSGAFDRVSHDTATALLGDGPDRATLEVVGRLVVRGGADLACAVTGRARVWMQDHPVPTWTALRLPAGVRLRIEATGRGYLAVAGGFAVGPVLGSRSTCLLGPLGPPAVRVGDVLPVGSGVWGTPDPQVPGRGAPVASPGDFARPGQDVTGAAGVVDVRVVPGPHLPLVTTVVTVVDTSRIGVRLRRPDPAGGPQPGPVRAAAQAADLPSLGVLPGTIQVLPAGDWMVLGPDAGTMGGYPVAGVVISADLHRWAHVRPGDRVRLVPVDPQGPPVPVPRPSVVRIGSLS